MRNALLWSLFGLAALALPAAAGAQTAPSAAQTPLQADGLTATVQDTEIYDTNVVQAGPLIAAQRGLKLADLQSEPSVVLGLVKPLDRQAVFMNATLGYDFYQRDTTLNKENIDVTGGFRGRFGRCASTLSGEYGRRQIDEGDLIGPVTRNVVSDSLVTLSGSCTGAIGFSPFVNLSNEWVDNSAPLLVVSNRRTFNGTAGVQYSSPRLGQLSLYGGFTKTDYSARPTVEAVEIVSESGSAGYDLYTGGVRYDRHLGARIEATLALAYTVLDPMGLGASGFQGPTYQADISYRVSGRITTKVHIDRETLPSLQAGAAYSIEENYNAEIDYQAGARTTLALGESYSDRDYRGALLAVAEYLSHDTRDNQFVNITYNINNRITLVLDVRRETRIANPSEYNYTGGRFGLTAKSTF
jgi:hypothetical protein